MEIRITCSRTILFLIVGCLLYIILNMFTRTTKLNVLSWMTSKASQTQKLPNGQHILDCVTREFRGVVNTDVMSVARLTPTKNISGLPTESRDNSKAAFELIYKKDIWVLNKGDVPSGSGSTLEYTKQTTKILDAVIDFVKKQLGVSRVKMLDVPCGDMTWMRVYLTTRNDIEYTGYDIVPSLIKSHQNQFSNHTQWKFENRDVLADGGLREEFHLIFNRDMLQHLYYVDILKFLHAFSESGSRFLLTTTHSIYPQNIDLPKGWGRFRTLNLEAPPVSLPPPLCYSKDGTEVMKYLALWKLPLFQVTGCTATNLTQLLVPASDPQQSYYACGGKWIKAFGSDTKKVETIN